MSPILWLFTGSVPEDGDYAVVWACDEGEAMAEGRKSNGYVDDPDYTDDDFSVRPATATEIIEWAASLVNRVAGDLRVEESVLDTAEVRAYLTDKVRSLLASHAQV